MTTTHLGGLRRMGAVTLCLASALLLNGCIIQVPWNLLLGGWREGIPAEGLTFASLSENQARQAASAALIGLREKSFNLKDVRVLNGPATNSVLLMASMAFNPPGLADLAKVDGSIYQDAVLPVFVKVTWKASSLTHFDVTSRIIRTPFHSAWVGAYDATGSADSTPAYLLQRANDLRTLDEAAQMNRELDRVVEAMAATVRSDLPWVIEEVVK